MRRTTPRRFGIAVATVALLTAGLTGVVSNPTAAEPEEPTAYDRGYELGLQAYRYGFPLVTMQKTFRHQTSVNVPNRRGFGPVNRFNPVRAFTDPADRSVVAPNLDTLYAIAWLDLHKEPRIVHVPRVKNRYYVIPMMTPYTENFANLGSVGRTKPGDYAVVGPDDAGIKLPKGVKRIVSPYNRVWIIQRIYADNDSRADQRAVNRIQDKTTIVPLSKYGKKNWKPRRPQVRDTKVNEPGLPKGMKFYDRLSWLLEKYPAPEADAPLLEQLAEIGVGPGKRPSRDDTLDPELVDGMTDAVADGPAAVLADAHGLYGAGFAQHNGYLVTPTGTYGTDYALRAVVTQVGLGALRPNQAIYPLALLDRLGSPLTGAKRYVVHVPGDGLPPVRSTGFWSLTVYDSDGFLVPNPIDRFAVNDRTDLHVNEDGSIDLFLQASEPEDPQQAQNWLPTPDGSFHVLWRMYAPRPKAIPGVLDGTGWTAPALMPVAE